MNRSAIFSVENIQRCVLALLTVAATTAILWAIGRDTLGDAVISLLYLVPIGYSTTRWGQVPGIVAAVGAALAFDFFFIPPFYTFTVGSLEGWLLLVIFLAVAVLIVGRIQYGLSQAQAREREAIFMYELAAALAGQRTRESAARTLAEHLQRLFQADLVQVGLFSNGSSFLISAPEGQGGEGKPDRVLPIMMSQELAGEISIWQGKISLPPEDSRLLQSYTAQGALALERARLDENRMKVS